MSDAYIWAENGTQYYSTTGMMTGGTEHATALDYALDSILSDAVYVGGDTVLDSASYAITSNLAGNAKSIIRSNDSAFEGQEITIIGITGYFLYSASAIDGMTIQGPFIIDDTVSQAGEFLQVDAALTNCVFRDLVMRGFLTQNIFRTADGMTDNLFERVTFEPYSSAGSRQIADSIGDSGNILRDCKFYYSSDSRVLTLYGNWMIENPEFYGNASGRAIYFSTGVGEVTIKSPKYLDWYDDSGNYLRSGSLFVTKNSTAIYTINEYHGAHVNSEDFAWVVSGAYAVINVVNSWSIGGDAKKYSDGTINLDNCYLIEDHNNNGTDGATTDCQQVDDNDGNMLAKLTNYPAPYGAIIPNFDDLEDNLRDVDCQVDLVEKCIEKGAKPILFIQPGSSTYAEIEAGIEITDPEKLANFNRVVALVAQEKVEIGIHGMTHMPLDANGICSIKKAASIDSYTVTYTATSSSFELSCPDYPAASISLTLDIDNTKSMGDIYDVLEASEYYTVSEKYWYVSEDVQGSGRKLVSRLLKETSWDVPASTETGADIEFDLDAWYRWEISTCRAWLLAHFPSLNNPDIKYMATPHGITPDAFIQFLNDNEDDPDIQVYLDRGNKPGGEPDYNGDMNDIRKLNTKLMNTIGWTTWAGGTVSDWDAGTITYESIYTIGQAIAEYTRTRGAIFMPYSHDKELEANEEMWGAFLDGVRSVDPNLLKSMSEVDEYIKTAGTQDATYAEVWNVDWSSGYGTWNLRPGNGSALIENGKIITGIHDQSDPATDLDGTEILFMPTIGPYTDGATIKSITDDDYTPTGYEVRKGATVRIRGGGHVDMSGLSDTDGEIDMILHSEIDQFTPAVAGVSTPIRPWKRAQTVMIDGACRANCIC